MPKVTKPRVYLSKSKAGKFDDIVKAKNYMELLGFEVVEFVGGTYSDELLLSCDYLLTLPPNLGQNGYYRLGRGQFTEFIQFRDKKSAKNAYIISNLDGGLYVDEFVTTEIVKKDWQKNWGILNTYDDKIDIINYDIVNKKLIHNDYYLENCSIPKTKPIYDVINKPMLACVDLLNIKV